MRSVTPMQFMTNQRQDMELKSPMSFMKQGRKILAPALFEDHSTLMTPVNQSLAISNNNMNKMQRISLRDANAFEPHFNK